ncbi:MAG TPA: quinone-dependent dihydroorotate dehydrogenase [Verrucomicrobiota bacterium]|nr:quinone-dependent dihydroorotate dehydrogenase [Verrucomicrobiota bacterium]HNU50011.1 quinone-dependent dihydroorotate dehydrogenase [Verrucomicrobiota bacterium]
MSFLYPRLVRPLLFRHDPEWIHEFTLRWLGRLSRHASSCRALAAVCGAPALPVAAFGLRFPNPVGLAAGMDKEAAAVPAWEAMGFGFSELGAVTRLAQPGNPAPRVFRAIPDQAIVNRMGFNNQGAEALAARLQAWRQAGRWPAHPVGINLGKTRIAPIEQAADDYATTYTLLWRLADFFVVNVSSPNTPNLRRLQDKSALDDILAALQQVNRGISDAQSQPPTPSPPPGPRPILVKVAPDLSFAALDDILDLAGPRQVAGIVATNTTLERPTSGDPRLQKVYAETGGLSGRPLRARSTEVIRHLYRQTGGRLPIIGVGGIFTVEDAWEKITAGATLLQLYTGFVFEGPTLPRRIVRGLRQRLAAEGLPSLSAAVGNAART